MFDSSCARRFLFSDEMYSYFFFNCLNWKFVTLSPSLESNSLSLGLVNDLLSLICFGFFNNSGKWGDRVDDTICNQGIPVGRNIVMGGNDSSVDPVARESGFHQHQSFGFFERRLVHLIWYASMTRALTDREVARMGGEPKWGITPSDPMGTTVRRITGTGGQRMIIRNQATYAPNLKVSDQVLERFTKRHSTSFQNRIKALSNRRFSQMFTRWKNSV